jgi:hypothetical protein
VGLVTPGERQRLHQIADLLGLAALHLRELAAADGKPATTQPRGRPRKNPEPWQEDEVLRLRHANGKLGYRAIGEKVDLSWRVVQRILDAASQKGALTSQNSSADGKDGAA